MPFDPRQSFGPITNSRSIDMDIKADAARGLMGKFRPSMDPKEQNLGQKVHMPMNPQTHTDAPNHPHKGCGGCMGKK